MHVDRNAAAIVLDGNRVILMDGNQYCVAESGECFVDAVVHDLVDKVVKPGLAGGADIHARPFPYRLDAAKDLYL